LAAHLHHRTHLLDAIGNLGVKLPGNALKAVEIGREARYQTALMTGGEDLEKQVAPISCSVNEERS